MFFKYTEKGACSIYLLDDVRVCLAKHYVTRPWHGTDLATESV